MTVTGNKLHWRLGDLLESETVSTEQPAPSPYLIIDCGSWQTRAGYSIKDHPSYIKDTMVHKYQLGDKEPTQWSIGRAVPPKGLASSRSPFESGVLVHHSSLEHLMDEVLTEMKFDPEVSSVVFTECPGNPTRTDTAELLFECYGVGQVTWTIDSLLAVGPIENALFIDISNSATHVILKLGSFRLTRRINWGGHQASDHLLKLLQQKYPAFPERMTPLQARLAMHRLAVTGVDYLEVEDVVIEYPTPLTNTVQANSVDEEVRKRRRQEQMERLRQAAAAGRRTKALETHRRVYETLKDARDRDQWEGLGWSSKEEFMRRLQEAEERYREAEQLNFAEQDIHLEVLQVNAPVIRDWVLLEMPDNELEPERLAEKRKLRLIKASADARAKAQAEKERLAEEERQRQELEDQRRLKDPQAWLREQYERRKTLKIFLHQRLRKQASEEGRRAAASTKRLRTVMTMTREDAIEDEFGADDSDWQVYNEARGLIANNEQDQLAEIEAVLAEHDPDGFMQVLESEHKITSMDKWLYGPSGYDDNPRNLHLNVERSSIIEPIFEPRAIGIQQAGLEECIKEALCIWRQRESPQIEFFLTGGFSQVQGMRDRIEGILRSWWSTEITFPSLKTFDILSSFRGAAKLSREQAELVDECAVTRSWYDEHGGQRLRKTSWFTNPL